MWIKGDSGQERRAASREVEGADGIGFEIVEGNGGSAVVRGLRGGMDDERGPEFGDDFEDPGTIADVGGVMADSRGFRISSG